MKIWVFQYKTATVKKDNPAIPDYIEPDFIDIENTRGCQMWYPETPWTASTFCHVYNAVEIPDDILTEKIAEIKKLIADSGKECLADFELPQNLGDNNGA